MRRNSSGRRLSGGYRLEDIQDLFDENDDEQELLAAREEAEERRQQKARSPFRETPGHQQRHVRYTEWLQMANDNVSPTDHPPPSAHSIEIPPAADQICIACPALFRK